MGRAELEDCIQVTHGLDVVSSGSDPAAAREMYAGPRLRALMVALRERTDYVLVASASTSSSDADAIALASDGVLIVVTDGVTTHAQTSTALVRFERLDVMTLGAVSVPRRGLTEPAEGHAVGDETPSVERVSRGIIAPRVAPAKRPVPGSAPTPDPR